MKLGKKLGVVEDPRTIMAGSLLRPAEVKVPSSHRVAAGLHRVPMFKNDEIGDCTQAKKGHAIMAMESSSGQHEIRITDEDIVAAYERVGGYVPGDPSTDNGAYELDSLNDWRKIGIGRERDGTPHKIGAFTKLDHTDHREVKLAHYVFGGLMVCAALPNAAQDQVGDLWDITEGPDAKYGSWGGHSMYSWGYSLERVGVYTWAEEQKMTWDWWDRYVDEVYAVISEDYVNRLGRTPQGFNQKALLDQLRAL